MPFPKPAGHKNGYTADLGVQVVSAVVNGSVRANRSALEYIMEALQNPTIQKMGVCGIDDDQMANLLERVKRRVTLDKLFDVTVMVSIGKNPDLTRIQQDIAGQLGLCFQAQGQGKGKGKKTWAWTPGSASGSNKRVASENATQLHERIMKAPRILFILRDLQARLDLDGLGIQKEGEVHGACKLILTSKSEEVLSDRMKTQRTIKV